MLSFDNMKTIYKNTNTIGQELKVMSDEVVQETFDNDIGTKLCYLYDYAHDDQPESLGGYDPKKSNYKVPVKLRFIIKAYKSAAKDDPEYHIMFEPDAWNSMSCKPQWFVDNYEKFGVRFPVGLYVDIPDDRGVYNKWIVFYDEQANQFPKFGVMQCNYKFQWIEDDGINRYKRSMWGAERTQNSYTSGVWRGDKTTVFDEQGKFWLPWNPISSFVHHDMRLFISMLQKEPFVYIVTKIKNTAPRGIIAVTVKQTEFNQHVDYVNLKTGEMYANYYSSNIKPEHNEVHEPTIIANRLVVEPVSHNIKIGLNMDIYAKLFDGNNKEIEIDNPDNITWKIMLNNVDITNRRDIITYYEQKDNLLTIKFLNDARFVGKLLDVECKYNDFNDAIQLEITH